MTIHPLVKGLKINNNSIFEMKKKRDLDDIFLSLISGFPTHFRFGGKSRAPSSGAIFKAGGGGVADVVGCPGDWRVHTVDVKSI